MTPTTARVYFPSFTQVADRLSFMSANGLKFIKWLKPDEGVEIALVRLPPTDLHPELVDPIQGLYQITLPAGLSLDSVAQWATGAALRLVSYDVETGVTVVHPWNWSSPAISLPRVLSGPVGVAASTPAPAVLYVQFAPTLNPTDITSIGHGLQLTQIDLSPTNLATFEVDPTRVKADIQLLSDLATVQCVSSSPDPCAQVMGSSSPATSGYVPQPIGQPSYMSAQVEDGVLVLSWSPAAGATAYAIFQSQTSVGPFQLVAIVAGNQHTRFHAVDLLPRGSSAYFTVLALHPCMQATDLTDCDVVSPTVIGGGASTAWTNPAAIPVSPTTTAVGAPTSEPSPSPSVLLSSSARVSPSPVPGPGSSQSAPQAAPRPLAQTLPGAPQLSAPTGVTAVAADGHVSLTWQTVAGASSYRIYRSGSTTTIAYVGETSDSTFTDIGGAPGSNYQFEVAAVAPDGLVGQASASSSALWVAASSAPTVVRNLPSTADVLAGRVRFQVDAHSGSGGGSVQWRITGPASATAIGSAVGRPTATAALSWSASLTWDTTSVPDGTYTVSATVVDSSGAEVTSSLKHRIQNGSVIAPTQLSATSDGSGVALSWEQPAEANAAMYLLFRDQPISGSPLATFSADRRTFIDEHVSSGAHIYQILLVDVAGHRSLPASASVAVAGVAAGPSAAEPLDIKLLLPDGEPLAPGGRVTDRLVVVAPAVDRLKFELSPDGISWSDVGAAPMCGQLCALDVDLNSLAPGAYLMRATTQSQVSRMHSFVRAEPVRYPAPDNFLATAGPLGVVLSWSPTLSTLPSAYLIERRTSGGAWMQYDWARATTYIDSAAPPGTQLEYRVAGVDTQGTLGSRSSAVSISLPSTELASRQSLGVPEAPAGLQATFSLGRAVLTWQPVRDSDGYVVERAAREGESFATVGITGTETFADMTAVQAGQYTYQVRALNGTVEGPPSSAAAILVLPDTVFGPISSSPSGTPPPPAPETVKASVAGSHVDLSWTAASGTSPGVTYNLYRTNPASGALVLAASRLPAPAFADAGLSPGTTYGYAVTAVAPDGAESSFSVPAWASLAFSTDALSVTLVAPVPAQAALVQDSTLNALAEVTGAAGIESVSFGLSNRDGSWRSLPSRPVDPGAPSVPLAALAGGFTFWATSLDASSLAPGSYQLRVQVRDRAGRSQDRTEALFIGSASSRAPPTFNPQVTTTSGGAHLEWASAAGTFAIQRSLFGPDGPFEPIATTEALQFDDPTTIPGETYWYRVIPEPAGSAFTSTTPASVTSPELPSGDGAPNVQVGPVSRSELSIVIAQPTGAPALPSGLQSLGSPYEISATSLATATAVHWLGETARISFRLAASVSGADARSAAVYHWDEATASWVKEDSSLNPDMSVLVATVAHFSTFDVAAPSLAPISSADAPPPAPTPDSNGTAAFGPSVALPTPPAPLVAAPDGEVVSLRTSNSRVYKNSDGSLRQTVSSDLLNYRDATGNWQKIDTNLTPDASLSGYLTNAAGPLQLDLPSDLSVSPVRIATNAGTATFTIEGANSSPRQSSASSATYAAVLSGVDAHYTVVPSGLKENLVIGSPPAAPPAFVFDISTGNLVLQQHADGSVIAVDALGRPQFTINAPWMHEARSQYSELGVTSNNVAVLLTGGLGSYRLTYQPDPAWLNDPARVFPVTVDPTITVNGSNEYDDQINSYSPGFNYAGYTYLPVGYTCFANCGGTPTNAPSRAMVQFNGFLLDGLYASSATLSLYQYTNYGSQRQNCCVGYTASASAGTWNYCCNSNGQGVTWNNQPGYTDAYGSATSNELSGAGWLSWNVTTLVNSWATHSLANNGFVIHAASGENGPYNNNESFYGGNANNGLTPQLTINYDTYLYNTVAVFPNGGVSNPNFNIPNAGGSPVEVVLWNAGTATWGTDTHLNYRWWVNGSPTAWANGAAYVPHSVASGTWVVLRTTLVGPASGAAGSLTAMLQVGLATSSFGFGSLAWASPSYACDQYVYFGSQPPQYPLCTSSGASAFPLVDESATITGRNLPPILTATTGSLVSIPVTIQDTVPSARWASWSSTRQQNGVMVGSRDYWTQQTGVTSFPNLRTFLPQDVSAGNNQNVDLLVEMPGDPGDYRIRIDAVHVQGAALTWFADQGNAVLEVPVHLVAPGDDKTTVVPAPLNDGSSLDTNTSNGEPVLSATDFSIPELGSTSLHVARTYNGANSSFLASGTGATSLTYGAGWTFDFMRSLRLGVMGTNTYSAREGIYTDAQGRSWVMTWNSGRSLWEDAAGNRTVAASTATVLSAHAGSLTVPGIAPVDVVARGATMLVADSGAPRGWALNLNNAQPDALIIPSSQVPAQQNGTVEFEVQLGFPSTDPGTHTLFSDTLGRFKLVWSANSLSFTTTDTDTSSSTTVSISALGWTNNGTWHHVGVLWNESGSIQLVADATASGQSAARGQSPIGDLYFGYDPSLASANPLVGRIAEIRIEGQAESVSTVEGDIGQLSADGYTLYLGAFDPAHGFSSASGTYLLTNPDQTIEEYNSSGQLIDERDRVGNRITYSWDSVGRLSSVADGALTSRNIAFAYTSGQLAASDFSGRSVTYTINASGDLTSVTRSNQVPNPLTGVLTSSPATTSYSYLPGHLLSGITDPRGGKTLLSYDQSYRATVLADGPVGYWRLGETSGLLAVDSAGSNAGSIVGGVTLGQLGPIYGDVSSAFKLDGSTGYVRAGSSGLGAGAFSLEGWVNHLGVAWSSNHEMVASLQGNATYLSVNGGSVFLSGNIGGVQRTLAGGAVPASGWHHLLGSWDGTYLRLYIDGVLSTTGGAYSGGTSMSGNVLIGTYDTASYFFKGELAEVGAYAAALPAAHVQAHFLAGRLGAPTASGAYAANVLADSPAGYWRLGEATGGLAADESGYGYQGSYNGGITLGTPGGLSGDAASAAALDGSTGYIKASGLPMAATDNWTLEALINPAVLAQGSSGNGAGMVVMTSDPNHAGGVGFGFGLGGLGNWGAPGSLWVLYEAVAWTNTGFVFPSANTWYHVAVERRSGVLYAYVNGRQIYSGQTAVPLAGNGLTIGSDGINWGRYFNGAVAEVAVYSSALSSARILAHYQAEAGRTPRTTELGAPSYTATVNADNPTAYWRLGETSGSTAVNQVSTAPNGTYTGGYTLGALGALAGDTSPSVQLNGSSGYVSVADSSSIFGTPQVSVEAWVNAVAWITGGSIVNRRTSGNVGGFTLEVGSTSGQINFGIQVGSSWYTVTAPGVLAAGAWHHLVGTYDGATQRLYVDGVLLGSSAVAGTINNPNGAQFLIGQSIATPTAYFNGYVEEVATYSVALAPARVSAHFRSAQPGVTVAKGNSPLSYVANVRADNPNAYWRLAETSGATAVEQAGFAYPATYNGTTTLGLPGPLTGEASGSASFDGSSGYAKASGIPLASTDNWTLEAFIFPSVLAQGSSSNGPGMVVMTSDPNNNIGTVGYGFGIGGLGGWGTPGSLWVLYEMVTWTNTGYVFPSANTWYHVVVSRRSGVLFVYVNGAQVYSGQTATPLAPNGLTISADGVNYGRYFKGLISEVAVYSAALSPARILAHYQAGRTTTASNTSFPGAVASDAAVGYWRLGDLSGSTAAAQVGSPGTYSGSYTLGQPGAIPSDANTSVRFSGSTGTVALSSLNVSAAAGQQATVELWMDWLGGSGAQMPFGFSGYDLELLPGTGFGFNTGNGDLYGIPISALPTNSWVLVDAVFTNGGVTSNQLYINGLAQALSQLAGTPTSRNVSTNANISGWATDANYKFNGLIADVSVYNAALTPMRIQLHYAEGVSAGPKRVNAVLDARGDPASTFFYNDGSAVTRVLDARGLNSYYTFQSYGGRTLSVTDTGGNVTQYVYDGGAAYRLLAMVTPSGIRTTRIVSAAGGVGRQDQTLVSDRAGQPAPPALVYMDGATPAGATLATFNEGWVWDGATSLNPGRLSHRSTPAGGFHEHYFYGAPAVFMPAGSTLVQWVFIQSGVDTPDELALELEADNTNTNAGWSHRAHWGYQLYDFGCGWGSCGAADRAEGAVPSAGRWVALTVNLGPAEGASTPLDVGMAGHVLSGIKFGVYGGTGAVWWGPTVLQFPGAAVSDSTRAVSTFAYNQFNDVVASVDPNGVAAITDFNPSGEMLQAASGIQPLTPHTLSYTPGTWAFENNGNSGATNPQALQENQNANGLQSDLYQDFSLASFHVGTVLQISTTVTTSGAGPGGALLVVEDSPTSSFGNAPRRSAPLQTGGTAANVTLPFVVDESKSVRVLLWQENFVGTTTWTNPVFTDISPAPDSTLQASATPYSTDFEQKPDRDLWSATSGQGWPSTPSGVAHGGLWSAHTSLAAQTGDGHFYRSFNVLASSDYQLSAWVLTVASGSQGGSGGAALVVTQTETGSTIASTTAIQTEAQWQLLQLTFNAGSNTSINVRLDQSNFRGDAYFDDLSLLNLNDSEGAMNWAGSNPGNLVGVTWHTTAAGSAMPGTRQISLPASSAVGDVQDALQTAPLRNGATYVISVWASSSVAGGSIDLSLRDGNKAVIPMDYTSTCAIGTALALCQNSVTWNGADNAAGYLLLMYGGSASARTITIAHPSVALASQRFAYSQYGMVTSQTDVFGHSTSYSYDSNGLYPTQKVVTATPSPNLTTNYSSNSVGQVILTTRVSGSQSIAEQTWRDSWGRVVGDVKNCVIAIAPPGLCNATPGPATNVMTRLAYDPNGNLTDTYTQSAVSGAWVDTHHIYDADGNQIDRVDNCVTTTNPCDGATNAAQNVVTAQAFDAMNSLTDIYRPLPGCTSSCVALTNPQAGCPGSTCADEHRVYNTSGWLAQDTANYGGSQDVSQANVTTQYAYDADGRVTDTYVPITSASLQTGQIDEHRVYDVLGRLVTDIKAYALPSWMPATTPARTDYAYDLGGRLVSVTGPGTGATGATNRIVVTTDYDALGRPLYVKADPSNLNAVTRLVYDPRGALHVWTPATQQLAAGMETTTNLDLAGQAISAVKDDGAGGSKLTTSTSFDAYGRATDVVDPRGIDTNTAYDALDRPSGVTQNYCPSGNSNPNCSGSGVLADQNLSTSYVYDLAGNRAQLVNPRGIVEFGAYDALGRLLLATADCQTVPAPPSTSCGTQSSDQNVTSSQTYDQLGHVLTTTDPLGRVNVYGYDALGRKTSETVNCVGSAGTCNGGVTSSQNLTTQWQYDAEGDLLKKTSPRQCTSTAPCYRGDTGAAITDGANLATGYTDDGLLRLASVVEDQGVAGNGHRNATTTYAYDPAGHMLGQTDPLSHTTTYTVDNLGRTTQATDANSNVVQTNYSLAGEVTSTVNGRGKTTSITLDRLGRLVGLGYFKADGTTALTKSFGYDADGNLTSFSDTDVAQTTVAYDHLNRPLTVTAPSPLGTTTYSYFLDGAVNTIVDANGTTTFSEDRLGRTLSMADPLTNGTTSYVYDAAGRLTGRTEGNGIVTTVTYSATDQLTAKTEVAGSTTLASWTNVTYDLAQNRTAETLAYYSGNPYPDPQAGTSTYLYDTENQINQASLPGRSSSTYLYDPAHNLTSNAGTSQTYNSNESLQTVGSATTGSDADGNQLKDANGNVLSWNSLSQLEQFSTSETYTYDAFGRLTTVSNGANVTKFVYQGLTNQVIQELNGSNTVVRSYAWDTMGRQLYVKSGGTSYYEITNPHGDLVALATASAIAGTQHFDPWGNPTYAPTGITTPFGFQGAVGSWTDAATGFVSMGVRWYYPKVGRFLSSDPAAGTADARTPLNGLRWLYGANDPLIHDDPTGLYHAAAIVGGCDAACQAADAAAAAQAAADGRENHQHAVAESTARVSNQNYAKTHPSSQGVGPSWLVINGYDVGQHFGNAWNHFTNDKIDKNETQDNLIAIGQSLDPAWRARYVTMLSTTGTFAGQEQDDLTSGDPGRILGATAKAVFVSFVITTVVFAPAIVAAAPGAAAAGGGIVASAYAAGGEFVASAYATASVFVVSNGPTLVAAGAAGAETVLYMGGGGNDKYRPEWQQRLGGGGSYNQGGSYPNLRSGIGPEGESDPLGTPSWGGGRAALVLVGIALLALGDYIVSAWGSSGSSQKPSPSPSPRCGQRSSPSPGPYAPVTPSPC